MYNLFLDDLRNPTDCLAYMAPIVGSRVSSYSKEWVVVRSYDEFIETVQSKGIPSLVSYDHDLGDVEIPELEKTGVHCARWLAEYCRLQGLDHPDYFIHSRNTVGAENIKHSIK